MKSRRYRLRGRQPGKTALAAAQRKGDIPPGKCGFQGCEKLRLAGAWRDGGSYLCRFHRDKLLPVRALFDPFSRIAERARKDMNIDEIMTRIKSEEKIEERLERDAA